MTHRVRKFMQEVSIIAGAIGEVPPRGPGVPDMVQIKPGVWARVARPLHPAYLEARKAIEGADSATAARLLAEHMGADLSDLEAVRMLLGGGPLGDVCDVDEVE